MGSIWGDALKISIFGESHGPAVGVVIDGLPPGIAIDQACVAREMERRAPGRAAYATARREADHPRVLSGILDMRTTGTPLCAIIENADARSSDYGADAHLLRPGHADFPALHRYRGFADPRGGGHFSGRLTAPLVFAGAIARCALRPMGVDVYGRIAEIAGIADRVPQTDADGRAPWRRIAGRSFPVFDDDRGAAMRAAVAGAREEGDSVGGIVDIAAFGVPPGWGDPMFGGLENRIASIIFGVPAVKGISFGAGFEAARMTGSQDNDPYTVEDGRIMPAGNRHGGILGGISTGMPIEVHVAVKPTPSIAREQTTVDARAMKEARLSVKGRHDPCIVPRAVPALEAAVAVALLDAALSAAAYAGDPA